MSASASSDAFVLDCSVTMAWCFEDESTRSAERILERLRTGRAVVPPLWNEEVANVLLVAIRSQRLAVTEAERFLALVSGLPISVVQYVPTAQHLLDVGIRTGLSAYDTAYLDVANREGLPLATLDSALKKAARKEAIPLL